MPFNCLYSVLISKDDKSYILNSKFMQTNNDPSCPMCLSDNIADYDGDRRQCNDCGYIENTDTTADPVGDPESIADHDDDWLPEPIGD